MEDQMPVMATTNTSHNKSPRAGRVLHNAQQHDDSDGEKPDAIQAQIGIQEHDAQVMGERETNNFSENPR